MVSLAVAGVSSVFLFKIVSPLGTGSVDYDCYYSEYLYSIPFLNRIVHKVVKTVK